MKKWHIANVQKLAAACKEAPLLLSVESGGGVRDELSSIQLQSSAPRCAARAVSIELQTKVKRRYGNISQSPKRHLLGPPPG